MKKKKGGGENNKNTTPQKQSTEQVEGTSFHVSYLLTLFAKVRMQIGDNVQFPSKTISEFLMLIHL